MTNVGEITTIGSRAHGIMAQSVGAGGGSASSATNLANLDTKPTLNYVAPIAVGAADGASGSGDPVGVENNGTITGAIDLGAGTGDTELISSSSQAGAPGSIENNGTFNSGIEIRAWRLENNGRLSVGGDGNIFTTTVTQDDDGPSIAPDYRFTQTGSGVLAVDIDALAGQTADLLVVDGDASIGGSIEPMPINLLPGRYIIVEMSGWVVGSMDWPMTKLFRWLPDFPMTGSQYSLTLSPQADFTPEGLTLTTNQAAVAGQIQSAWNAGGSDAMAPAFADLYRIDDDSDYLNLLDALSAQNIVAKASDQAMSARTGLDASMSCPSFEGDGTLCARPPAPGSRRTEPPLSAAKPTPSPATASTAEPCAPEPSTPSATTGSWARPWPIRPPTPTPTMASPAATARASISASR
mgnify:FL=1